MAVFSWAHLALIVLGGAIGTAARAALTLLLDEPLGPLFVPAVNTIGAFALGAVIGALSRRESSSRTRGAQQFFGSGVLGGFTTYSALAVQSVDPVLVWLAAASVVVGTLAGWAGLLLARGRSRA